jgi:hypothetical protein
MNNPIIQFILDQGVPKETLELLLMFPIIATIMVITRQIIGIKAFGVYTPSIVAIVLLFTGLKYGITLFITVLIIGTATRLILKKFRLLYTPRVAIMITVISISVLVVLVIGGYFKRTGFASVSIFPLLILISIIEKFIQVQIEKGAKTAAFLSFFTIILAIFAYYIVKVEALKQLMLTHPWIILLIILFNFILGKWSGLRISEYLRFKEILKSR